MVVQYSKFLAASVSLGVQYASADLPVHCVRPQVAGSWKFHLGEPSKHRTTCGHQTPDVDKSQPDVAAFNGAYKTVNVELDDPNTGKVDGKVAQWTMIYDEGMNVNSDDYEFFTFNHFKIPENSNVHGKKYFESFCGKTEVGWYQDKKTGLYGCYKGERADDVSANKSYYHLSLLEEQKQGMKKDFLAADWEEVDAVKKDVEGYYSTKVKHHQIVDRINSQQSSWKAGVYSDEFIRQKMGQLQKRAQIKMGKDKLAPSSEAAGTAGKREKMDENLPKEFNWDNVNGTSFIEPVLDQQDCGSCYAVSSVHMLTGRYRVHKKNPDIEGFSVNFPLYCSDLNQGCNGGYPSLVSLWSKHVGLIPKKCTNDYYTSSVATCKSTITSHVEEDKFKDCVKTAEKENALASVSNWNYIGGYYGGCSAGKMMADMFQHGPLAVALEPGMDFMYYRSGIYKSTPVDANVPWVKVDHAVLAIGWGEDAETKDPYWVVQNSWGDSWGERGNIRMIRGDNDSGVEFQAVAAYMQDGTADKVLDYARGVLGEPEAQKTDPVEEKKTDPVDEKTTDPVEEKKDEPVADRKVAVKATEVEKKPAKAVNQVKMTAQEIVDRMGAK